MVVAAELLLVEVVDVEAGLVDFAPVFILHPITVLPFSCSHAVFIRFFMYFATKKAMAMIPPAIITTVIIGLIILEISPPPKMIISSASAAPT